MDRQSVTSYSTEATDRVYLTFSRQTAKISSVTFLHRINLAATQTHTHTNLLSCSFAFISHFSLLLFRSKLLLTTMLRSIPINQKKKKHHWLINIEMIFFISTSVPFSQPTIKMFTLRLAFAFSLCLYASVSHRPLLYTLQTLTVCHFSFFFFFVHSLFLHFDYYYMYFHLTGHGRWMSYLKR